MITKSKSTCEYGFPDQQAQFSERYIKFLECVPNLKVAVDTIFQASRTKNSAQRVIWGLARLALDDEFQVIVLTCANGYSSFAKQPLRALFEKVVTLFYLIKNPGESKLYQNYRYVLQYRQLQRLPNVKRSAADKRQIRRNYKNHSHDYPNKSRWNRMTIPEMAKEVGIPEDFIELAYYNALQEAHPTLISMLRRFHWDEDGSLWWNDLPPVEDSALALKIAHFFVLEALEAVKEYFKVKNADKVLAECMSDYFQAWNITPPAKV